MQGSYDRYGGAPYEALLRQRYVCPSCGETWRLENLSVCCECYELLCSRCCEHSERNAHGEKLCACGGIYVG